MHAGQDEPLKGEPGQACDRRGDARIESGASAIARIPASPHRVTLIDVSRTGCRIRVGGLAVPVGATVTLDFGPDRRLSGQVVWAQPRTAGIRFDEALPGSLAAALGIEPAVGVVVDAGPASSAGPVAQGQMCRLPHWLRVVLGRAA
ncbi:PilZ domain-containing protein [Tsuneonella sp. YG55]|uniref:PilZ domain-containing protein n=1 Tax=Tsuneonella litorea TaxID=2976475 RepID=A0A9X2W036_9SPHN|nr:PilZ domain-containing protein [Tsuneonella litorea]MCT2557561.1 PilZ domain-containing protein [Tsuneonella litorea]